MLIKLKYSFLVLFIYPDDEQEFYDSEMMIKKELRSLIQTPICSEFIIFN